MSLTSLIIFLFVGAVAGWLAGQLMKGVGFGLIGNMVVGVIGAFVAGFVLPIVGISIGGGILGSILHATIGAVILLFVISLVKKGALNPSVANVKLSPDHLVTARKGAYRHCWTN